MTGTRWQQVPHRHQQAQVVAVGQPVVEHDDVGLRDAESRIAATAFAHPRFDDVAAAGAQRLGDRPADQRLVVDDQHACRGFFRSWGIFPTRHGHRRRRDLRN